MPLSVHPNVSIFDYRDTEYEDYMYFTIAELQEMCDSLTANSSEICSSYLEQDRNAYYHPDLSFSYSRHLKEIIAICDIIDYKMLCCERFISHSSIPWNYSHIIEKSKEKLIDILSNNTYMSYFDLLDLFPNDEIELIIENLIQNNKLHHSRISRGMHKGKNVITID